MRVLILDSYYSPYLRRLYKGCPDLEHRQYEEQFGALIEPCFGTFDAYSWHLRQLGHQAAELVINCIPLQAQWAREHGIRTPLHSLSRGMSTRATTLRLPPVRSALRHIVHAQIEEVDPDVVYIQDIRFISPRSLARLQRPGRLIAGQVASRSPSPAHLAQLGLVVTSFPHFVERYRAAGIDAEYLPLAFDERILARLQSEGVGSHPSLNRPRQVLFVGGLDPRVWGSGVTLLEHLVRAGIGLDVFGYRVEALPKASPLRQRYRGEAWGLDMYRLMASAKIVVNRHGAVAEGHANNMRLYEATGVGALVLTESAPNLPQLFQPNGEVVTYKGRDDILVKLRQLLAADDERQAIAVAGQERTLTEHTYTRRMSQLVDLLADRL